jgi:hypothetical protein
LGTKNLRMTNPSWSETERRDGIKEHTSSFTQKYRFGFNKQEQETELGEYYSFEYADDCRVLKKPLQCRASTTLYPIVNWVNQRDRVHDARLGRMLSADPDEYKYSWQSVFAYFGNSPTLYIDYMGKGEPTWYTDDSRRNKREIRRFKRHLDKEERRQIATIESMRPGGDRTNAVNNMIQSLTNKYGSSKWFYRTYNDEKSTGQKIIVSMGKIWAWKVDPWASYLVAVPPPAPALINWPPVGPVLPGTLIDWYINNSGAPAQIQISVDANGILPFQNVQVSLQVSDNAGNPLPGIAPTNITAAMVRWNSPIINVPVNGRIQLTAKNIPPFVANGSQITSAMQVFIGGPPVLHPMRAQREIGSVAMTTQSIKDYIKNR